tara:strand:+ start:198 stop:473 length:276 start_codon:yes stop_codon:yes gene_type:complete
MAGPFKMKGMSFGNSPIASKAAGEAGKKAAEVAKTLKSMTQDKKDALELKRRQDKRQQYMINDQNIWDMQDEIDKADIKSKRGKVKGKDYY